MYPYDMNIHARLYLTGQSMDYYFFFSMNHLEILYEIIAIIIEIHIHLGPGLCSRFRVLLLAGGSGVQTPVGENFFLVLSDRYRFPPSLLYDG